ncbi:hypothetical protein B0H11DRAFT_2046882 [Mycena galericulata]|nr:hypothetical protein B0H11DRAFT_2046882 [Mycena galericulata]
MAAKQLRFNSTVDEYEERDESKTHWQTTCDAGLASSLTPSLFLRPGQCPAFDFSLPSSVFRADPRMDPAIMSQIACTPPQSRVIVRVASAHSTHGLCTFPVVHNPEGYPVTVGDVLSTIRDKLRQLEATTDPDAEWYHARRVDTVAEYLGTLDEPTRWETKRVEEASGTRRVDRLLGNVVFDGVVLKLTSGEPDCWLVDLQACPRYARE